MHEVSHSVTTNPAVSKSNSQGETVACDAFLSPYSYNQTKTFSLTLIKNARVSDKSMNHITMAKGSWKMYVCRYAERYQCACNFVIC